MVIPVNSSRWTSGGGAAFSFVPRRFISRLQLIVGRLWWLWWFSAPDRSRAWPNYRKGEKRGVAVFDRIRLLSFSRGVESSRRRCLAINYREGLLPPSLPPLFSPSLSLFLSLSFLSPAPETDRPSDRSIRHSLRRHRWTVAAPDNNGARGKEGEREGGRKRENCPISLYLNSALNPTGRTLSREIRRGMGNATRKGPDLGQSLRIRSLFRKLPSHRWGFPFVRLNIDGSEPFFLFLSFPSESEFSLWGLFDRFFVWNRKVFFFFFSFLLMNFYDLTFFDFKKFYIYVYV